MSSATATTCPESVGSCRPPTPPTPPPPPPAAAASRGAPVRRQLDFSCGAGAGDLEDDDDFLCRALDDIEPGYGEAKRRAPPCVCGRGDCAVERDEKRGRWMYVCPSRPKCKHVALCDQVDISPKPSNPCVFNVPSNLVADAKTPINNINPRGAGTTTPINISPQGAVATTPFNVASQGATTPVNVRKKGAGTTAVVKVSLSPRGARSSGERPICQCTAGKCKVSRVGNEDYYVCPIPKGQGACSHKVPVKDAFKEPPQTGDNNTRGDKHLKDNPVEKEARGNNIVQVGDDNANGTANPAQPDDEWPFDIVDNEIIPTAQATPRDEVCQESPSMLHLPVAMVKTPTKSPMPTYGTRSPIRNQGSRPVVCVCLVILISFCMVMKYIIYVESCAGHPAKRIHDPFEHNYPPS